MPFNFAVPGPGPRNSRRKWTQYGNGDNYTNVGNSNYHALQTKLEKRYSSGLTFLATYTWSKLIDDSNVSSNGFTTEDPRKLSLDRGLAKQTFLTGLYQLLSMNCRSGEASLSAKTCREA